MLAFRGELAINPVTLKGDLPAGFNALNQVVIHHDLKPGNSKYIPPSSTSETEECQSSQASGTIATQETSPSSR